MLSYVVDYELVLVQASTGSPHAHTQIKDIIRDTHAGEELEVLRTGVHVTVGKSQSFFCEGVMAVFSEH